MPTSRIVFKVTEIWVLCRPELWQRTQENDGAELGWLMLE